MAVTTWTLTGDLLTWDGEPYPLTGSTPISGYVTASADAFQDAGHATLLGPTFPLAIAADGSFSATGIPDSSETGQSYTVTVTYRPAGHGRPRTWTSEAFTVNASGRFDQMPFVDPTISDAQRITEESDARVAALVAGGTLTLPALADMIADEAPLTSAIARQMPQFLRKAAKNEAVTVALHGASILAGYNVNGSTTEGVYQADAAGVGRQCVAAMAARYGLSSVTVVNAAMAGVGARDLMWGGLGNDWVMPLARVVARYSPDLVIFNANSNDITSEGASASEYAARIKQYLREARRLGVEVLVIPPFTHFGDASYAAGITAAWAAFVELGIQPVPVGSVLEGATAQTMIAAYRGAGSDTTHPNATGAAVVGQAFAAALPNATSVTVGNGVPPVGTWDDPATKNSRYVWTTDAGVRRSTAVPPVAEGDGMGYSTSPSISASVLMRGSLAAYDMLEGADTQVLYDKSGYALNGALGTTTAKPTWVVGGGLTFDAGDHVRIPQDSLNRLKITPGLDTFTVRLVAKAASANYTATIFGRRGDSSTNASAPFGIFTSTGNMAVWERGQTRSSGVALSTTGFEEWLFSFRVGEASATVFRQGAYVGALTVQTSAGDDSAAPWDIVLGGRFSGTSPGGAVMPQWPGTLHWVEVSRTFIHPTDTEAASLHTALVSHLASRSLTWAA